MVHLKIGDQEYVLRGDFYLLADLQKKIVASEVKADPSKFEAELNALMAIPGQNMLLTNEQMAAEKKKAADKKKIPPRKTRKR